MTLSDGLLLAFGGNSIVPTGEKGTIDQQWAHTDETMAEVAALWQRERPPLLLTHGNGPQMGRVLLRSELSAAHIDPLPIDVAVADTEAGMGYMIQHLLSNRLLRAGLPSSTVTVITRVEVDAEDPAFKNPTKPIGIFYTQEEAERLRRERGWDIAEDPGRGWRRVVVSPGPKRIIEVEAIRSLLDADHIVIAAGGGGIPVARDAAGTLCGCEGVIDKDLTSVLLAEVLGMRRVIIVTGVPRVCLDWTKPTQREVERLTAAEAKRHLDEGQFAPGSMGPKIDAAIRFARVGGTTIITQPGDIAAAVAGNAGTWVVPD